MCNAINKNGLKCKLSKSYGEYCYKHSYLDDDFQPGSLENIKPKDQYMENNKIYTKSIGSDYYDWIAVLRECLTIFFK
jgi:hypothetical protein